MIKQKNIALISLSILSLIILSGLVSAVSNLTVGSLTSSNTLYDNEDPLDFTFTITYTGLSDAATISFTGSTADFDGTALTLSINNLTAVNGTAGLAETVSGRVSGFEDMGSGTITVNVVAEASTVGDTASGKLTFDVSKYVDFCDYNNSANLDVTIDKVKVTKGFGDEGDFWYPLDEVEIDVEIENEGDWDVEELEVEFCLYDVSAEKCILDEGDVEISEDNFDLDEGDDITIEISFKVDPEELVAGNNDYRYYVTVSGKIDDKDAGEKDGDGICSSDYEEVEIVTDDLFVILDDITLNKDIISCGGVLSINADVWNIGDEDLDDDEVFVLIYNKELGINKVVEFSNGIDSMDKEELGQQFGNFYFVDDGLESGLFFNIPSDAEEKTYRIAFTVFDDEDRRSKDIFENREEDKAEYFAYVKVEGSCFVQPELELSASLESEAKAGGELRILVNIVNTGDETKTYSLSATGYESWASVLEVSGDMVLSPGEMASGYVLLKVDKEVYGKQTLDLRIIADNKVVLVQPYEITFGDLKKGFFSGLTGNVILEDEYFPYLLGIGIFNVLLIVAIVILAVRLGKRRKQ
jgi:hypothetical protein